MADLQFLSADEIKRLWQIALNDDTPVKAFASAVQERFIALNRLDGDGVKGGSDAQA